MDFYVGLHQPSDAPHFDRCMVSVNRLMMRRRDFFPRQWIMDSGAFTQVALHGDYTMTTAQYAEAVNRWARCGQCVAAVSQDWMCEPFVLAKTGKSVAEHQQLTVERYCEIRRYVDADIAVLPVLQGYQPEEYAAHVEAYGDLLVPGAWVGVGSVCKRNANPTAIVNVLTAIHAVRPDLRLHGFGIKTTSLAVPTIWRALHSADSMAWSRRARWAGRNQNDWREAAQFARDIAALSPEC